MVPFAPLGRCPCSVKPRPCVIPDVTCIILVHTTNTADKITTEPAEPAPAEPTEPEPAPAEPEPAAGRRVGCGGGETATAAVAAVGTGFGHLMKIRVDGIWGR